MFQGRQNTSSFIRITNVRSRLGGFANIPREVDTECAKVTKNVCKDIPKKEEVMKEVEICVQTPKEVVLSLLRQV